MIRDQLPHQHGTGLYCGLLSLSVKINQMNHWILHTYCMHNILNSTWRWALCWAELLHCRYLKKGSLSLNWKTLHFAVVILSLWLSKPTMFVVNNSIPLSCHTFVCVIQLLLFFFPLLMPVVSERRKIDDANKECECLTNLVRHLCENPNLVSEAFSAFPAFLTPTLYTQPAHTHSKFNSQFADQLRAWTSHWRKPT